MRKMLVVSLLLVALMAAPAFALTTTTVVASGAKVSACASVSGTGSASAGGHAFGMATVGYGICTFADVKGGAFVDINNGSGHAYFNGCSFGVVIQNGISIGETVN